MTQIQLEQPFNGSNWILVKIELNQLAPSNGRATQKVLVVMVSLDWVGKGFTLGIKSPNREAP